ncbi:MAG: transposase [Janthinobacterium lividum]
MSYLPYLQSKDAALFVYLAWGTRDGLPVLGDDQVRQAAYLAITMRTRSQLCQVLAIDGTPGRIHLIVRFPPSLAVSLVARMAQEAGGAAIAHQSELFHGRPVFQEMLWERDYTSRTLQQTDAAEAPAYLRRQIAAEYAVQREH